jgi:hypothetical protein
MPDLSIYVLPPAQNLGTPFFQTRGVFVTAIVPRGTRLVIFTRHTPVPHVNTAYTQHRLCSGSAQPSRDHISVYDND